MGGSATLDHTGVCYSSTSWRMIERRFDAGRTPRTARDGCWASLHKEADTEVATPQADVVPGQRATSRPAADGPGIHISKSQ